MRATALTAYAGTHAHRSKHVLLENVGRADLAVYEIDRNTGELIEWTQVAPAERIALQSIAGSIFQVSLVDRD